MAGFSFRTTHRDVHWPVSSELAAPVEGSAFRVWVAPEEGIERRNPDVAPVRACVATERCRRETQGRDIPHQFTMP